MRAHACLIACYLIASSNGGVFDWVGRDTFDVIMDKYSSVSKSNCKRKSGDALLLPDGSVSMEPQSNQLLDSATRVFRNRTCLLTMHDLTLSRSYFVSLVFKMTNTTNDFWRQPGWQYYQFRQTGLINAFPDCINRTGLYFDFNKIYPNFVQSIPDNTTIDFYAPLAFRYDDFRSAWNRENSQKGSRNWDIGVGADRNYTDNAYPSNPWYTAWLPDQTKKDDHLKGSYTIGVKYSNVSGKWTSDVYTSHTFFGPPLTRLQDDENLPVKFTRPYFDCGRRNKWIVSAVSPIVDMLPRYRKEKEIKEFGESRATFVATHSMGTDFLAVDINPCPAGEGNPIPNIFAGIARCKGTTMCQPLTGWGFARGGYECVCRPGYRYPAWQNGPFQGALIELATKEEYEVGFDCLKINNMKVVPSIHGNRNSTGRGIPTGGVSSRQKRESRIFNGNAAKRIGDNVLSTTVDPYVLHQKSFREVNNKSVRVHLKPTHPENDTLDTGKRIVKPKHTIRFDDKVLEDRRKQVFGNRSPQIKNEPFKMNQLSPHHRTKRGMTDDVSISRMDQIFEHIDRVKQEPDCKKLPEEDLVLPGDVSYGAKEQFRHQAGVALAMAHFLSGFHQNVERTKETWGVLKGDSLLNPDQLHAEVLSHVMADHKIRAFGIWYDEGEYREPLSPTTSVVRDLFAPYAFQEGDQYRSVDRAGDPDVGSYLRTDWFRKAKMRWMNNMSGSTKYKLKIKTRTDVNGTMELGTFYFISVYYVAAKLSSGMWSSPHFPCDGYLNEWVIKYTVPFFGRNPIQFGTYKFKGVVTVDIRLDNLDINQCPAPFWTPNAFKDTARCDFETTFCVPVEGHRFKSGAYRCHCKQGYEYPFIENAWFFAGSFLESELKKKENGEFSRYEFMKCRTAGTSAVYSSFVLMILLLMVSGLTSSMFC